MYDLLIKHGTLVDGTGAPRFQADVAVKDGVIVKIAEAIEGEAEKVIDATGLIVSPGFIDTHIHGANGIEFYASQFEQTCGLYWQSIACGRAAFRCEGEPIDCYRDCCYQG